MPEELHIAQPGRAFDAQARAARRRTRSPRSRARRVHAASPSGKLVVTLEASSADEMMSKVTGIQRTDGVLSAALVYQCADTPGSDERGDSRCR